AAMAELVPGAMDSSGAILGIGAISSVIKAPRVGLAVAKSGRTTGLTQGNIVAIDADVVVKYRRGCGKGKKFKVEFTNQVIVQGPRHKLFSDSGDSGSLIVTDNSCHQPVALLFAGGGSSTVGNPIQDVVNALGVRFVGDSSACSDLNTDSVSQISRTDLERASAVKKRHLAELRSLPSVIGVGVGASDDDGS